MYVVTSHALDKWRVHHPEDGEHELLDALSGGEELSHSFVTATTGHKIQKEGQDRCVTANDKQGFFIISDDRVITYIPLNAAQIKIVFGENRGQHDPKFFAQLLPGTNIPLGYVKVSTKTHSFLQDRPHSLLWALCQEWSHDAARGYWTASYDTNTTMLLVPVSKGKYMLIPHDPEQLVPKNRYIVKYNNQLIERYASVLSPNTGSDEP